MSPEGRQALHDALQDGLKGPGGTAAKEVAEEEAKFIASLGGKFVKTACLAGGVVFAWWSLAEEAGAGSDQIPYVPDASPPRPGEEGYDEFIDSSYDRFNRDYRNLYKDNEGPECDCKCRTFVRYYDRNWRDSGSIGDFNRAYYGEWESKGRMSARSCKVMQSDTKMVVKEAGIFADGIDRWSGVECEVQNCGEDCEWEKGKAR